MRGDEGRDTESFRRSEQWKQNVATNEFDDKIDRRMALSGTKIDGKVLVHSFSGNERNHLFVNHRCGEKFTDQSALSGLDSKADGRGMAFLDWDRDGWQDVVTVNSNAPLTEMYHNDIGTISNTKGGMIAVRFIGGSTSSATSQLSNRDGYGARVHVRLSGGVELTREHLCGVGYASQNSATMILGIGDRDEVESMTVNWPSGRSFSLNGIREGSLVTAYENRTEVPFTQEPYRSEQVLAEHREQRIKFPLAKPASGKIQVFTTMATWCPSCVEHLSELNLLKHPDVTLFGVPVDVGDDHEKLADYVSKHDPPYQMLSTLDSDQRLSVSKSIARALDQESLSLPSTVITDAQGYVLDVMSGVPSLSQVIKWIEMAP